MPRVKRPVLIIHNGQAAERVSHDYFLALRAPKGEWVIPESRHTGGPTARPREYEDRVVGFLDRALRGGSASVARPLGQAGQEPPGA